ncbi:MAG TPA: MBL fold metallo-hydrolase [Spirochaetota bacterium]|nr:MBL fold metallo-hydrolase [Spirochaetota bacterium]HPJ33220.1 MBL fold metallo-hydrolase [Spirochaetota bacterium]
MIEVNDFGKVTQIRLSRELNGNAVYWVSSYLVDGLLIDTGSDHTSDELVSFLKTRKIKQAVNTHYHEDHIGGNKKIRETFGIDIYAHRDSVPLINSKPELYPYQEIAFGYPEPSEVKIIPDTIETGKYKFRVIETPGHSRGHVVLMEMSEGWCFSGDIFVRENIKYIRPEENIGEQIESMKMLYSLPSEKLVLFTATGRVIEDGRKSLNECVENLNALGKKVREMSGKGKSPEEIMTALFGGEHSFSQLTNGQFSTLNLVKSILEVSL